MPAHRKDFTDAVRMYEAGLSVEEVAVAYGIRRQAMWKALKRRNVTFRSNLRHGSDNHFSRGGVVRNANFVVIKAVRRGLLTVGPCEVCGLPPAIVKGQQRIHGHHDDYNFLLQVRWLCRRDHHEWHKTNTPIPRAADWQPMPRDEIASHGGRASIAKRSHTEMVAQAAIARAGKKRR